MLRDSLNILKTGRDFMESRILLTGVELNIFSYLAEYPFTAEAVADKIGADSRAIGTLMDALAAMGILVKRGGAYRTAPRLASSLAEDTPDSVLPMLRHMAHLWRRWSRLTDIVKGVHVPENAGDAVPWTPDALKAFIGAMHVVGEGMAARIARSVSTAGVKLLLDVGGGSGTYTIAFLKEAPQLQATLFDRPEVVAMARERLEAEGVLDRAALAAGDFYRDELPPGHDLALLSAIIHQNSPGENIELFRKVFRALIPGGRILIRDHIMNSDRTRPKDGAIFAVNMLVGTAGGGTYAFDEVAGWLQEAGFADARLIRDGEHMDQLVEAVKK